MVTTTTWKLSFTICKRGIIALNGGRFINADRLLESGHELLGNNLYAYCGNNPVNLCDPTGELAIPATWLIVGLLGLGAYGVSQVEVDFSGIDFSSSSKSSSSSKNVSATSATKGVVTTVAMAGGADPNDNDFFKRLNNNTTKNSNVKNDIVNKTRTTTKTDIFHNFPDIVDNYAGFAKKFPAQNSGTLYQLKGSLNGIEGRFEWIIDKGNVTHRFFVKGGGITGVPIMP